MDGGSEINRPVGRDWRGWRKLDARPGGANAGVYYGAGSCLSAGRCCRWSELGWTGGNVLSKYARKITMQCAATSKFTSQHLIDQISATDNITAQVHSSVVEAKGETQPGSNHHQPQLARRKLSLLLFIIFGALPRTDC